MSIVLIWWCVWLEVAMVTVLNDDVRAVLFFDIFVVSHRPEICWIKHHQTPRTVMHTVLFFVCLFVCLFVWGLSSHMRIFHSYGDVIITGEGLQFFTSTLHSWQLSSDIHTYCRAFRSGAVTTCFYDLLIGLWRLGFEHPTFRGERATTPYFGKVFKLVKILLVFTVYIEFV